MNHSTKSRNYKDTWMSTDYELLAIQLLNSDQTKTYEVISQEPPTRSPLVRAAMLRCPNPFQLCSEVSRYARKTHRSTINRMPTTINLSLQKLAAHKPARKPMRKLKAQGVAA